MAKKCISVTVHGASDDLIEVGGDLSEEFGAYSGGRHLRFDDGTVLFVQYTKGGVWRINPVKIAEGTTCSIAAAPEDDEDNYSDVARLVGPIASVKCSKGLTPSLAELREAIEGVDFSNYEVETLQKVADILGV